MANSTSAYSTSSTNPIPARCFTPIEYKLRSPFEACSNKKFIESQSNSHITLMKSNKNGSKNEMRYKHSARCESKKYIFI